VFTSPKAIRFYKTGGPEVLVWEEVRVGNPGPGEARLRHTAVGLNYVDIYVRRGLYPVPLPSGLGYTYEDFVERIETITQGRKLPVVYDSVGKTPDGKFRRRKTYPVLILLANGLHSSMLEFAATVFVTFLLIFDPIGLLPLFVALTHRQRKERRRIATRSIAVAAITLVVVALVGHLVLRLLGIGLPAFRIAGGLLLLLLSNFRHRAYRVHRNQGSR
jgi:NADPH:quinone reductase-like Zn-dependent oxidoreductase